MFLKVENLKTHCVIFEDYISYFCFGIGCIDIYIDNVLVCVIPIEKDFLDIFLIAI